MPTIVVAGGTGLLGTALVRALRADGFTVAVLTRHPARDGDVFWAPERGDASWAPVLADAHAVINLAGSSIAGGRWTVARKASIRESRVTATIALTRAVAAAGRPPAVFVSSSAVGYYGYRSEDACTERTPPGTDFLASVCREWEQAARPVESRSRLVLLRTGVVLARDGGALPQLALPFRLFAGGPVGSGRQYVSWIHLDDWVAMTKWAIGTASVIGALNATSPVPVTNAELARALGRALGRPAWLSTPGWVVRAALGEMADALVLGGQRVLPEAAVARGFVFRYPTLEPALGAIYGTD